MAVNNSYDKELCLERHNTISDILGEHHSKLEDHESRLSEMERNNVRLDEIVRQNIEQTTKIIASNNDISDKMSSAILKLTENQTDLKIQMVTDKQDLEKQIITNKLEPGFKYWQIIVGAIITGVIGLMFYAIQSGVFK